MEERITTIAMARRMYGLRGKRRSFFLARPVRMESRGKGNEYLLQLCMGMISVVIGWTDERKGKEQILPLGNRAANMFDTNIGTGRCQ